MRKYKPKCQKKPSNISQDFNLKTKHTTFSLWKSLEMSTFQVTVWSLEKLCAQYIKILPRAKKRDKLMEGGMILVIWQIWKHRVCHKITETFKKSLISLRRTEPLTWNSKVYSGNVEATFSNALTSSHNQHLLCSTIGG